MLRQLRIPARPSFLRSTVCRRQFGGRPQFNNPNYAPHPGPYFYPPPKSPASRFRDMAIGSALTLTVYLAYQGYDYHQYTLEMKEFDEQTKQYHAWEADLNMSFAEARRNGDRAWLRELTFGLARQPLKPDEPFTELGPLPSLPEGDKMHGKGIIPEEDTLVLINDFQSGNGALIVQIALNVDTASILHAAPREDNATHFNGCAFHELVARINYQASEWIREGRMREYDELMVTLLVRDQYFEFSYYPLPSRVANEA
ncbi:hypothetical protein F4677DRAFT_268025 [Hypoxylon crocopeplum]|nr:hypothetical protein F4677DRAFT_268025 [Hypoxylon crocopeplum]